MAVAHQLDAVELVSVDSMQVYRGMDIGTAKPTADEQAAIKHHLIDLVDPGDTFSITAFQAAWRAAEADIAARGVRPLLVGGTGLYLRAVIDNLEVPAQFPEIKQELIDRAVDDLPALYSELVELDPLGASRIDAGNDRRIIRALEVTLGSGRPFSSYGPGMEQYPDIPFTLLGLRMSRDNLIARINARYDKQMEDGFLEEVMRLTMSPGGISHTARQALGYRELLAHIEDGVPLIVALENARVRTRRFARRQMKWFERDPRITWIDIDKNGEIDHGPAIEKALALMAGAG